MRPKVKESTLHSTQGLFQDFSLKQKLLPCACVDTDILERELAGCPLLSRAMHCGHQDMGSQLMLAVWPQCSITGPKAGEAGVNQRRALFHLSLLHIWPKAHGAEEVTHFPVIIPGIPPLSHARM